MIPCYICGQDASTSWVKGFTPSPDSQKMALCAEHNNQENRLAVANAWQQQLLADIALRADIVRQRKAQAEQVLSVHFAGGGMLSFICTACEPTEHGALRVESADGAQTFIPLLHVRDYALRPLIGTSKDSLADAKRPVQSQDGAELLQSLAAIPEAGDKDGELNRAAGGAVKGSAADGGAFFNKLADKPFSILTLPSKAGNSDESGKD